MHRAFETSTRRRQRDLSGRWEFLTDPDDEGIDADYQSSFPTEAADRIAVPSSWNANMEYAGYVGPAWYRRTFHLPEATGVLLRFEGIGGAATAYLDGETVERTNDGTTVTRFFKPELDAGEHELVVRVDNRPEAWEVGPTDARQGGIHRPVVLAELPEVYVTNLAIDTELEDGDALVEADVTLHSIGHVTRNRRVTVEVGDEWAAGIVPVAGRDASSLTLPLLLEDVDRWTPDEPTLYDVVVRVDPMPEGWTADDAAADTSDDGTDEAAAATSVGATDERDGPADHAEEGGILNSVDWDELAGGDPTAQPDPDADGDELRERIGFREIETDGREILLDGEPIEVAAVTRRAYHPDWGAAQPGRIQDHDLDVIRAAGFDAVRCPGIAEPAFLDRCDEAGLLVLQGFGLKGLDDDITKGGSVLDAVRKRVSGTIRRHRNHPSVIAWELADEWATTDEVVRGKVGALETQATGIDDSRLIAAPSTADWGEERDRIAEQCDVVAVADDRAPGADGTGHDAAEWGEALDRAANRYGEKPIVVASFGGAPEPAEDADDGGDSDDGGSDGGNSNDGGSDGGGPAEWSESVQADRLEELIGTFREDPAVAGFSVRQFCDTPSDVSGVVSAYRQPKEAFGRLAALLDEE